MLVILIPYSLSVRTPTIHLGNLGSNPNAGVQLLFYEHTHTTAAFLSTSFHKFTIQVLKVFTEQNSVFAKQLEISKVFCNYSRFPKFSSVFPKQLKFSLCPRQHPKH
jgi:hypothetical protein